MNKRFLLLTLVIIIIAGAALFLFGREQNKSSESVAVPDKINQNGDSVSSSDSSSAGKLATITFQLPLDRAGERVTRKKFGQYITSQNSPVQPERFFGYHAGTDFEIFPEELDADVPVVAICGGKLLSARTASGYGGIAVQSCELDSEPVTVLYGHLNMASVKFKAGEEIKAGDTLASLGAAYSAQTDGERKHLHLGIHKGSAIDIRGYVQNQAELSRWIDPCSIDSVCE